MVDWDAAERTMREYDEGVVNHSASALWMTAYREDPVRYRALATKVECEKALHMMADAQQGEGREAKDEQA